MAFVDALRTAGLAVPPSRAITFLEGLAALEPPDVLDTFWTGRATLVAHPDDRDVYDRVFRAHFVGEWAPPDRASEAAEPQTVWVDGTGADDQPEAPDDEQHPGAVASATEALRHRRFDEASDEELAAMRRLMSRIELDLPRRRWRRTRPHRRGARLDVGRSLRRAIRTDGEVVDRVWRRRRVRRRSLVLLLDVSGSMSDYSRALLQFAFSAAVKADRVEVFAFGTRLTRLTDQLRESDPDAALSGAARAVVDWDSGTRIGASLDTLHRRWGRRGVLRGAVVLVASDGLERGEVELLRASMERLARQAHAVVWVNPLKVDPRYEPLARGMAAALPSVDHFLPGHDVASLDALADVIAAV
ncbi:VWA domain-containing protein [Nitriliruptoria bacterium AS10]|nr:VWA domain-containing protein [Salsipaludibacter albus]